MMRLSQVNASRKRQYAKHERLRQHPAQHNANNRAWYEAAKDSELWHFAHDIELMEYWKVIQ